MSIDLLAYSPVADKEPARDRLDLRVESSLRHRLERQAGRYGLKMTAYIKLSLIKQLELDEASDPRDPDEE